MNLVREMKQNMLGLNIVIYYFRETLLYHFHSQVSGLLLFADSYKCLCVNTLQPPTVQLWDLAKGSFALPPVSSSFSAAHRYQPEGWFYLRVSSLLC